MSGPRPHFAPSSTLTSVTAARVSLTPQLELSTLLPTLKSLSQRLQSAQHLTASFPALHTRLQRTALTTLRLADRTHTTLTAFRTACQTSLDNLDLIQDLFQDNQPTVAKSLLSGEAATAIRLASQSRALALQFEEAAVILSETLSLAGETRAQQESRRKRLAEQVANEWLKLQNARDENNASERLMTEAAELYEQAEKREEGARWKGNMLQMANVAAMVGSLVSTRSPNLGLIGMGSAAALAANVDRAVMRAREERAVHLKTRMEAREGMLKSGREVVETRERLRGVREEECLAGEVLKGIEASVEALRILAGEMLKAEGFWSGVGEGMSGGGGLLGGVNEGWEVLAGSRGRMRISEVQARWAALKGVCDKCIDGVGEAKADLRERIEGGGSEERSRSAEMRVGEDTEPNALAVGPASRSDARISNDTCSNGCRGPG